MSLYLNTSKIIEPFDYFQLFFLFITIIHGYVFFPSCLHSIGSIASAMLCFHHTFIFICEPRYFFKINILDFIIVQIPFFYLFFTFPVSLFCVDLLLLIYFSLLFLSGSFSSSAIFIVSVSPLPSV